MILARRHIVAIAAVLLMTPSLHAEDTIPWAENISSAQDAAAHQNRLVLLHFWAPSCGPCVRLEQNVFSQQHIGEGIGANYIPVKIDASQFPATARQYDVRSWPQDVVITPNGQVVHRMISPQDPQAYLSTLSQVAVNYQESRTELAQTNSAANTSPEWVASAQPGFSQNTPPQQVVQSPLLPSNTNTTNPSPSASQSRDSAFGGAAPYAPSPITNPQASAYPPQQANVAPQYGGYGTPEVPPSTSGTPSVPTNPSFSQGPSPQGDAFGEPAQPAPNSSTYASAPQTHQFQNQPNPVQPPSNQVQPQPQANPAPSWQANPYVPQQPHATAQNGNIPQQPSNAPAFPSQAPSDSQAQANPGNPPLGLEGCCSVTYAVEGRWVRGNVRWGVIHRGRTYLFTSEAFQQQFLANPDGYAPMLSGNDPVAFVERGELADGQISRGILFNEQIYLFESEQSLQAFWSNPQRYSNLVIQAMQAASRTIR